jgi:hypothetical protein
MYLLIYITLDVLPHTVILVCTFQMSMVQSLVEVFLFVQELDFLVYLEFDCVGCCFRPLILMLM